MAIEPAMLPAINGRVSRAEISQQFDSSRPRILGPADGLGHRHTPGAGGNRRPNCILIHSTDDKGRQRGLPHNLPYELKTRELAERFGAAGEGWPDADVACTVENRLSNLVEIVRTHADERAWTENSARLFGRHVILPQMHAVRLDQAGNIRPVVDNEKRARLLRQGPHLSGAFQKLPVAQGLFAQLDDLGAASEGFLNRPIQGGRTSRAGHEHVQPGIRQALAGTRAQKDSPLKRVAAVAKLLERLAHPGVVQLAVLFQTAKGLLKPFQIGLDDVDQPVPLLLPGSRQVRPHVALCFAGFQ